MLSKSTRLQVIYFCWQIQVSFEQNIANGNSEKNPEDLELNELDELEDELDERAFLAYRQKRIAEMTANQKLSRFGEVVEITGKDYVQEINKAGDGIWVILHLYKRGSVIIKYHISKTKKLT